MYCLLICHKKCITFVTNFIASCFKRQQRVEKKNNCKKTKQQQQQQKKKPIQTQDKHKKTK